jgi:hypothetical protein
VWRDVSEPDLKQLAVMLDIVATTDHPGEAEVALRKAVRLIRKAGLRGSDFIAAMTERDRALDLVRQYAARLDQLEAANQRLREANGHSGGTLAQALWQDAGMPRTVESRHAQWALALEAQGGIHLTSKEINFLGSCSRRSRLSQAQQNWLQDIIRNAIARTGQAPPP